MREKKFMPGPWKVERENIHIGSIATCHGDDDGWFEVWTSNWQDGVNQGANANLISAAPELLEALEEMQKQIKQVEDGDKLYTGFDTELIDHAIAKAYGETQ